MITGEYILDVVIFDEDTGEDVWVGNIFLNEVRVDTHLEFHKLAESTIKKEHGKDATIRIVGVFKL